MRNGPQKFLVFLTLAAFLLAGCATSYKARPLPFRAPAAYANAVQAGGATIAAEGFAEPKRAEDVFGFNVRGAGFLPVEVVFENQGPHSLKIVPEQTFLEDEAGNLWPVLDEKTAYDRATRYSQTKQTFKEGAYSGALGAVAGAIIGAAIGIVAGSGVGEAAGKGAALGGAAGATIGGAKGYTSNEAPRTIMADLRRKSLENRPIPRGLAYGFLFFPGEAQSARQLRMQVVETETGKVHDLKLKL